MVDSENSTTLPSVSRRALLGGILSTSLVPGPVAGPANTVPAADPILILWKDWQNTVAEATAWGAKWAALESKLARNVGFSRVQIPAPPVNGVVWAICHEDIDHYLKETENTDEMRRGLHAELAAQQAKWNDAAEQAGLDIADREEEAAMNRSAQIASTLLSHHACGLPGVIVKLELILRTGQTGEGDEEFPWQQIRSTIADLKRLIMESGYRLPA
jgi:hypothetical protein